MTKTNLKTADRVFEKQINGVEWVVTAWTDLIAGDVVRVTSDGGSPGVWKLLEKDEGHDAYRAVRISGADDATEEDRLDYEAPQITPEQLAGETVSGQEAPGLFRDAAHLKAWLEATGRKYLIFNATDLVDAVGFSGVTKVQEMVAVYGEQRRARPSGYEHPTPSGLKRTHGPTMPVMVDEQLTLEEIDEAIVQLADLRADIEKRFKTIGATKGA